MRPTAVLAALLALAASACNAPRPWGSGVRHYTVLSAGFRALDHDVADSGAAYALELASADDGWGYELVGTYAADDAGGPRDHDLEFNEVGLGLRRTWRAEGSSLTKVVGVGGTFTRVENKLHHPGYQFDDEGGAGYAHAAFLWDLGMPAVEYGTETMLGVDLRGLVGEDYDYAQLAIVLAFGR